MALPEFPLSQAVRQSATIERRAHMRPRPITWSLLTVRRMSPSQESGNRSYRTDAGDHDIGAVPDCANDIRASA